MDAEGFRALLSSVRYEVLPPPKTAEDKVLAHVPRDVVVTVTASPVKGLEPTLDLVGRLAAHGYRVVPHVPARLLRDDAHLKIINRLRETGVDDVFVPAGDADPPAGAYDGALPVLRRLSELGSPFARVGVAGYPQESHPLIHDDLTIQAMWDKHAHATYIVSNLAGSRACWVTGSAAYGAATSPCPSMWAWRGPCSGRSCWPWRRRSGWGSRRASSPGTPRGSCGSRPPAATRRTGCSPAVPRRLPRPRLGWRACTCSR